MPITLKSSFLEQMKKKTQDNQTTQVQYDNDKAAISFCQPTMTIPVMEH